LAADKTDKLGEKFLETIAKKLVIGSCELGVEAKNLQDATYMLLYS